MSYIQAHNLIKEYGSGETSFTAVKGMSFEIQQGEFAAIMGESGSGKSTLLTMMGALNSPSSGTYRVDDIEVYYDFADKTSLIKTKLMSLLNQLKNDGDSIAAYGAPAKGNTLLNYCGISTDLIDYIVDKSTYKQGLYTPGTHIPVYSPKKLLEDLPDYTLLLAWNFADEILEQQKSYLEMGGKFIIPIPDIQVV